MFLILLLVVTIVGFIIITVSAKSTPNGFLDRFTKKLNAIIFLYIAIGVFLTYNLQRLSIEDRQVESTLKMVDNSWMGINKIICDYYPKCPKFCQSLYFDWQKKQLGWTESNIADSDEWQAVLYVTFAIIQGMEDVLIVMGLDKTELNAWIATFLEWCHSSLFKQAWEPFKTIYNTRTIKFIDYLISKAEGNENIKNPQDLYALALEITSDPKFKAIINQE